MRILVVNDDGIEAPGIRKLAELARQFGEVTVAAPKHQCSGMSHRITVDVGLEIARVDFPVEGVEAYSIDGTPADCVKVAISNIMKEKPDIVFSGINRGYNIGYDILYSGTVGAAMEALMHGVPAIAYSQDDTADYAVVEKYFGELTEILLKQKIGETQIWNVNFPNCTPEEVKGTLYDRTPAKLEFYHERFELERMDENLYMANIVHKKKKTAPEGTDAEALLSHYISVSKLNSIV